MEIEVLEKVLTHPNIIRQPVPEEVGHFERERHFTIGEHSYVVEWWCNMIYLKHGGVLVAADDVNQCGDWPNRAKLNLQFYRSGQTVAIVELDNTYKS